MRAFAMLFAAGVLSAFIGLATGCQSPTLTYDDGEWQRKAQEEETVTVIIHVQ